MRALRIDTDAQWKAVHDRLATVRVALQATGGATGHRRSRDLDSPYLLSGFARCEVCGGAIGVVGGSRSSARRHVYGCLTYHKRGMCANNVRVPIEDVDHAVLTAIAGDVLRPAVVAAVVQGVRAALTPSRQGDDVLAFERELATVDRQIGHLTAAGGVSAVLAGDVDHGADPVSTGGPWLSLSRNGLVVCPRGAGRRRSNLCGSGTGIRTPVPWLRTTCPNP